MEVGVGRAAFEVPAVGLSELRCLMYIIPIDFSRFPFNYFSHKGHTQILVVRGFCSIRSDWPSGYLECVCHLLFRF